MDSTINTVNNLRICTYNCRSLKSSLNTIKDLCLKCDVILLQETWLVDQELSFLKTIHADFYGDGVSSVNTCNQLMYGRPYGGLAILRRKNIKQPCKIVTYNDKRIMGIEIGDCNNKILLLNVYLPYDCASNHEEYMFYLAKIDSVIKSSDTMYASILGDFNANLCKDSNGNVTSNFGVELINHCKTENLIISDHKVLDHKTTYTYVSDTHSSVSWLDHCVSTVSFHSCINDIVILHDYVTSDHLPLVCTIKYFTKLCDVNYNVTLDGKCAKRNNVIKWTSLSVDDLAYYENESDRYLSDLHIPYEALHCKNTYCRKHYDDIENFYNSICTSLKQGSSPFAKASKVTKYNIPGWNEYCDEAHSQARDAYILWADMGKPKQGYIFHLYKSTKARFKYALRYCKNIEETSKADKVASELLDKNYNGFWKEIKKKNNVKCSNAADIDGVSGPVNICDMWRTHFKTLLNSVTNSDHKDKVLRNIKCVSYDADMVVSAAELEKAVKQLKLGKACGHDGLSSEHFKYASKRLITLMSLCITSMFVHGYLPGSLIKSTLSPIVKDKSGDATDKNNYRPIALTTVCSKLIEIIILNRYEELFNVSNNQFGFRKNSSTDMCIYAFKQVIDYYRKYSSPVYVTFLDASKAFDHVNYWKLFDKLLYRKVPLFIVKLLVFFYTNQTFCILWNGVTSDCFTIGNGVRQGGVLSPIMFNIYMDDLSVKLNETKVGCHLDNVSFNHLSFADDMSLLAPSPAAMQILLNICEEYAVKHDIVYNTRKTWCMCIKPAKVKLIVPDMYLCGQLLKNTDSFKYLGYMVTDVLCDNFDITRQMRSLYARANMLSIHFSQCSPAVKKILFTSYCSNMYCSQLWWTYNVNMYNKLKVAYNNSYRKLMSYSYRCSASNMYVSNGVIDFDSLRRKSLYGFKMKVNDSTNVIIEKCKSLNFTSFYMECVKMLY